MLLPPVVVRVVVVGVEGAEIVVVLWLLLLRGEDLVTDVVGGNMADRERGLEGAGEPPEDADRSLTSVSIGGRIRGCGFDAL